MGLFDKIKEKAKEAEKLAKKKLEETKKKIEDDFNKTVEQAKEREKIKEDRNAKYKRGTFNWMYKMQVLNKEIDIILSSTVHKKDIEPKEPGSWDVESTCNVLGFEKKNYVVYLDESFNPEKYYLSKEAIFILTYMNYSLDSLENISIANGARSEAVKIYNDIRDQASIDGDWSKMTDFCINNPYDQYKAKKAEEEQKKAEEDELKKLNARTPAFSPQVTSDDFTGSNTYVISNRDYFQNFELENKALSNDVLFNNPHKYDRNSDDKRMNYMKEHFDKFTKPLMDSYGIVKHGGIEDFYYELIYLKSADGGASQYLRFNWSATGQYVAHLPENILLLVDGERHSISSGTTVSEKVGSTGEYMTYNISKELIIEISNASVVKMSVRGDNGSIDFELTDYVKKMFKKFVTDNF